ncbi:MAG TPA: hypothetical protein PKD61_35515, partial [Polyangiaceae bacterium]|nr:hypothetical protein [Polyangiaceae bacterium]
ARVKAAGTPLQQMRYAESRMPRRRRSPWLLVSLLCGCVALTSAPSPVHAAPDKKALSKARKTFQRATELEQAGNYPAALGLFREVGEVKMTPQVRFHIAFCEAKLGKLVAALGGYELALADAASVGGGFQKEVQTAADDLRARIPKLVIRRGDSAAAARVELDGVALGEASMDTELPVDPGPHLVVATLGSAKKFSKTVKVAESEVQAVEIAFEGEATSATPTQAPARDSKEKGSDSSPSRVAPIVVGVVGVAALAASGVFFLLRESAIKDLDEACGPKRNQCPASSESTYDDAKRYNTFSQIALGVGVVGIGTAATLWMTAGPSESKSTTARVGFVPAAAGADAGASLRGIF